MDIIEIANVLFTIAMIVFIWLFTGFILSACKGGEGYGTPLKEYVFWPIYLIKDIF